MRTLFYHHVKLSYTLLLCYILIDIKIHDLNSNNNKNYVFVTDSDSINDTCVLLFK